jgi:ABC-2 type transport system permease protein
MANSVMIVAVKEFRDYLTSKRFLLIFAVLLLMCIAAIIAGVASYNTQVSTYNQDLSRVSTNTTGGFRYSPSMPSMMLIFESFSASFVIVGWLLAIAIGFDLISKEKETGSLKLLLARPIFRDSIINGKIIGSTAILIVALGGTFLVAVALLLFQGIIPSGDDLTRLVTFFVMLMLFSLAFLSVAIAASALSKNSTLAILIAIGFVVFSLLVPSFSNSVSNIVLGTAPSAMITSAATSSSSGNSQTTAGAPGGFGGATVAFNSSSGRTEVRMEVNPAYTTYVNSENAITEAMDLVSPTSDLTAISAVVVDRQSSPEATSNLAGAFDIRGVTTTPTLGSSISSILPQIISLLVITIVGFVISYAKFIRMDVR